MVGFAAAQALKKRDMKYLLKQDSHNGLLNFKRAAALPGYARYFPSPDLAPFVEHYWTIEWDSPKPALRETLPYPSALVILEPGVAVVSGVTTKKFSRVLAPKGRVLGAKFRPGGLRPFVTRPVSEFTDQVFPLQSIFGDEGNALDARALAHDDHHAAIDVLEQFLRDRQPVADASLGLACSAAERIAQDREISTVEQLAETVGVGVRTLQRLFGEYVGVSPKWMIRRYRLQEAAERMAAAHEMDWAQTALDLGYSDQAHFIRDFRNIIGKAPADYFRGLAEISGA